MRKHSWKKYVLVFVITCGIFIVSWYLSGFFNEQKLEQIRSTQNEVATGIIANETQFDLLQELPCEDFNTSLLSKEIGELAEKITYGEQNLNAPEQILALKQQYTILEARDYLLTRRISERCNMPITTVLYFYTTQDKCTDCVKQGYVLDALRQKYPKIRVYSFDYNLDSLTVQALINIYSVPSVLPGVVINGETFSGFMSLENIERILPTETMKR